MKRLNLDGPINDNKRGAHRKYRQALTYAAYERRVDWWSKRLGIDRIKQELSKAYTMIDSLLSKEKLRIKTNV